MSYGFAKLESGHAVAITQMCNRYILDTTFDNTAYKSTQAPDRGGRIESVVKEFDFLTLIQLIHQPLEKSSAPSHDGRYSQYQAWQARRLPETLGQDIGQ